MATNRTHNKNKGIRRAHEQRRHVQVLKECLRGFELRFISDRVEYGHAIDALIAAVRAESHEKDHGAELAAVVNDTGSSTTETASDWRRELLKSGDEKKRAAAIYAAVEAACEKAKKVRRKDRTRFEHDGINWADLGCSGVEVSAHFYGDDGWEFSCTAYVEEASPDCRELPTFVEQELVSAGFTDVRVVTEW